MLYLSVCDMMILLHMYVCGLICGHVVLSVLAITFNVKLYILSKHIRMISLVNALYKYLSTCLLNINHDLTFILHCLYLEFFYFCR